MVYNVMTKLLSLAIPCGCASLGINSSWPAGFAMRGTLVTDGQGVQYELLGVGFCRGGPPGGDVATAMVSYVRLSGATAPSLAECFKICSQLKRCHGVEGRNSDDWCELQIPLLARTGDGSDKEATDWLAGNDSVAEQALTSHFDVFNAVSGSPAALTTAKPRSGFFCWKKVPPSCDISVSPAVCGDLNRYACAEGIDANLCGPCAPLHISNDGNDARMPGMEQCTQDPSVVLPTLRVSLASPWFGGGMHDEALYLAMIYGVKKAWDERAGEDLIPIKLSKRMQFPFNLSGHTDQWGYTLSAEQGASYGLDSTWDTRVDNHPMSGIRAMSSLKKDEWTTQYGLLEPSDSDRTRPHAIIGAGPDNSKSGLLPHSIIDLPISHAATFFQTPVLGWAFQQRELADKTNHQYYMRVNPVGLEYSGVAVKLVSEYFGFTRVALLTSGINRGFKQAFQDQIGPEVTFVVEDMGLASVCTDLVFIADCHKQLIRAMERLRDQDMRIILHEQDGVTHLDTYWATFSGLLSADTLYVGMNTFGDCQEPLLPRRDGAFGESTLWSQLKRSAAGNNKGEWDQMPGDCSICSNWAFNELPEASRSIKATVAEYNTNRVDGLYQWSSQCPLLPNKTAILACDWCHVDENLWVAPSCKDEVLAMRDAFEDSICVGTSQKQNSDRVDAWLSYLSEISTKEWAAAGAPRSFFDVFEAPHPVFTETGTTLKDKWQGSWAAMFRKRVALMDAMLLSLVAFNTWVRAAGDSGSISSTALRMGWRTSISTPIVNWLTTLKDTTFSGLTGEIAFTDIGERRVDYSVYQARGDQLAFHKVGTYSQETGKLAITSLRFRRQGGTHPPDREPPCAAGTYYVVSLRGCVACPKHSETIGLVNNEKGIEECECSAGFFREFEATPKQKCSQCPRHTQRSTPGARTVLDCTPCPPGEYAPQGSATCMPCPKESSIPGLRGEGCRCALGYYKDSLSGDCEKCPVPMLTTAFLGSTSVDDCVCKKNTYGNNGTCTACPDGSTTIDVNHLTIASCLCDRGTFMPLDKSGCRSCKKGMTCPQGASESNYALPIRVGDTNEETRVPLLQPAFWSSRSKPLSVFRCASEDKCLGGEPGDVCAGNLAQASCEHCKTGYRWTGKECMECSSLQASKALYPIMPVILLPPIYAVLYWKSRDPYILWSNWKNALPECAFIVLNFYQFFTLFNCMEASEGLKETYGIFALTDWFRFTLSPDTILVPECAGFDKFQATLTLKALAPAIMLVLCVLTWAMSIAFSMTANLPYLKMEKNRTMNIFLGIMFTFFSAIAALCLQLFRCGANPNGKFTMLSDFAVVCYESEEWKSMLGWAIGCIIVYMGGILALLLYGIVRAAKGDFSQVGFQRRWKFLFIKFDPEAYWWGVVYLLKNLLINCAFALFATGVLQLYWALLVIVLYTGLVIQFKPYRHTTGNHLELLVSACSVIIIAALVWFADRGELSKEYNEGISQFGFSVAFLPLIACLVGCVMVYLNRNSTEDPEKIQDVLKAVAELPPEESVVFFQANSDKDRIRLRDLTSALEQRIYGSISFARTSSDELKTLPSIMSRRSTMSELKRASEASVNSNVEEKTEYDFPSEEHEYDVVDEVVPAVPSRNIIVTV